MTDEINGLLEDVLDLTGFGNQRSLNATYGGKHAEYIDLQNDVIDTPEQFVALCMHAYFLNGPGVYWNDPSV